MSSCQPITMSTIEFWLNSWPKKIHKSCFPVVNWTTHFLHTTSGVDTKSSIFMATVQIVRGPVIISIDRYKCAHDNCLLTPIIGLWINISLLEANLRVSISFWRGRQAGRRKLKVIFIAHVHGCDIFIDLSAYLAPSPVDPAHKTEPQHNNYINSWHSHWSHYQLIGLLW